MQHPNPVPVPHSQPLLPLPSHSLKPGTRLDLPPLAGSADALAIAELAGSGKLLAVVAASPLDAQRLQEEIAWFAPALRCHLLPDWETLPYDSFSPHQDLISERLATLYAVTRGECDVLIVAAATALARMAPPSHLIGHTFFLKKGDKLDIEKLRGQLTLAGYQHVTQVVAAGEYSVRGGLIDLFPMGTQLPYRIELFDDEVETMRTFDVDSQRTLFPVAEIRLLPAREFPLGEPGRNKFRSRFRETFEGDASRIGLYKDVSNGTLPAGIEYYLPLFFDQESGLASLFDYLPRDALLLTHHDVPAAFAEFWNDTQARHRMLDGDRSRPVLPPRLLFLTDEEFFSRCQAFPRYHLGLASDPAMKAPAVVVDRKSAEPLAALKTFLAGFPGRVLLLAESPGRRATMADFLAEHNLHPASADDFASFLSSQESCMLGVAPLSGGFTLPDASIALLTENELYTATARPRGRREKASTSSGRFSW